MCSILHPVDMFFLICHYYLYRARLLAVICMELSCVHLRGTVTLACALPYSTHSADTLQFFNLHGQNISKFFSPKFLSWCFVLIGPSALVNKYCNNFAQQLSAHYRVVAKLSVNKESLVKLCNIVL